ncbi:MAG: phosphoribosyltransferase family protein [Nitrososphaerota archaeon]|nr:phosphoribosyltransferase family protein [Nitrososphaerales archaeon]MCX8191978.1 phosphoribosyltransferase family protein [Nitrososphaerales archaeon]MDW8044729.1 phosphoribosyltransferase family protein [Nitrososphaerota archaeon]
MKLLRMTPFMTRKLCQIIVDKMLKDKFYPDIIVVPLRGGAVIGRYLSDILDQPRIATIACEYYTGINETAKEPKITQRLSISVKDKVVLLADDVSDRGDTLRVCYEYIKKKSPRSLKTATLFIKPWSTFIPDYYAAKTRKWIVFLGEEYETIRNLYIKNDLETLRKYFSEREIQDALNLYNLKVKTFG